MVDALDADVVDGLPDVSDRVLLVDVAVHGEPVALGRGCREDVGELGRWVAMLVGVEPHTDDPVPVGGRLLQRLVRRLGAEVAQEAHDEV